ncbi:exonuclease domain-containing protein [Pragia fontium]|uniref:exonuclease domain-containing protein n=1 Tax=Pragia fontium TaxID=82985 RepID=UPI0006499269|nr:exonuclease domain-containing protein [Pragia fontium]AKJ40855.1 hypothetical protein QQ39_01155 [Pragia fontium]
MFHRLFDPLKALEKKRLKLRPLPSWPAEVQEYLSCPLPQADMPLDQQDLLVIDFETSGLDPLKDKILSIGTVTIHQQRILLRSASHQYLAQPHSVRQKTACINHIVPEKLIHGVQTQAALLNLLQLAQGKIVVAHCAVIEQRFIQQLLLANHLPVLPIVWLDTFMLEKSLMANRQSAQEYNLQQVRQRYGLPDYPAHDALSDAIATAELLLCQIKTIFSGDIPELLPLYQRSRRGQS